MGTPQGIRSPIASVAMRVLSSHSLTGRPGAQTITLRNGHRIATQTSGEDEKRRWSVTRSNFPGWSSASHRLSIAAGWTCKD